jgi:hypothetical protein
MAGREKESWLHKLRPGRHLIEAWVLSALIVTISNVLAQVLDSKVDAALGGSDSTDDQQPFTFDFPRLLRFLCLDLITAPINYKWQELLETTFPRHDPAGAVRGGKYQSIPLEDRDVEKNSNAGDEDEDQEQEAGTSSTARHKTRNRSRKSSDSKSKSVRQKQRKNWKNIWTKWFVDCITLGAIFNTFLFIVIMGFLNGTPQKIWYNLRTRTLQIILNGYKIWPFANIVAQAFIPFERRIIFFALVALFWNIYLSLVANRL